MQLLAARSLLPFWHPKSWVCILQAPNLCSSPPEALLRLNSRRRGGSASLKAAAAVFERGFALTSSARRVPAAPPKQLGKHKDASRRRSSPRLPPLSSPGLNKEAPHSSDEGNLLCPSRSRAAVRFVLPGIGSGAPRWGSSRSAQLFLSPRQHLEKLRACGLFISAAHL